MFKQVDIIIIGAGIMGLACAWKLASLGLKVKVVEKGLNASGASPASLGVVAYPSPMSQNIFNILHRHSLRMLPAFVEELEEASGINIGFKYNGSLELLPSETQLNHAKREIEFLNSGDFPDPNTPPISLVTQADALKIEPNTSVSEFGAIHAPHTGSLSVDNTIQALKRACYNCNVQIEYDCCVKNLLIKSNRVQGLLTNNNNYKCSKVLAATGVWTSTLDPNLDEFAHMEPVKGQAMRIETKSPLISSIVKCKKRYLVPAPNNTIYLGSSTEKRSGFNEETTVEAIKDILNITSEAVPKIADSRICSTWAGLRPVGRDSRPHIGEVPNIEGLYVATGHYKTGFGYLPLTAEVIPQIITKMPQQVDISALTPRKAEPRKKRRS